MTKKTHPWFMHWKSLLLTQLDAHSYEIENKSQGLVSAYIKSLRESVRKDSKIGQALPAK